MKIALIGWRNAWPPLIVAVVLLALISGGIAIYGLLLALFGVIGWGQALSAVRQTGVSDLRD